MTLNHVHLGTKDINKSVSFYSTLFGFKKKFDHHPGVFLDNEAGFLIAIDPVDELPTFPSWYHLGFCLASEQEALEMYKKCKSLNVQIVRDLLHNELQFVSFFILDPDGNKLEISWHSEEPSLSKKAICIILLSQTPDLKAHTYPQARRWSLPAFTLLMQQFTGSTKSGLIKWERLTSSMSSTTTLLWPTHRFRAL